MTFEAFCRKYYLWCLLPVIMLAAAYSTIFPRMVNDWLNDPNYSHGLLVPVISGWFVYISWPELKKAPVAPSWLGLFFIAFGLLLLWGGLSVAELYTSRSSFIFILTGAIMLLCGTAVVRLLALPLIFLFFMIPLPYTVYDTLALPLKALVSQMATGGLKLFGFAVIREGNIIMLPNISLEVVDACSGLRSLVSLIALGTAYAFIFLKGKLRRFLLIAATIPIAVLANALRVFITGVLARFIGAAAAEGFFHEFAGLAVFVTALTLTILLGALLAKMPIGPMPKRTKNADQTTSDQNGDRDAS